MNLYPNDQATCKACVRRSSWCAVASSSADGPFRTHGPAVVDVAKEENPGSAAAS